MFIFVAFYFALLFAHAAREKWNRSCYTLGFSMQLDFCRALA